MFQFFISENEITLFISQRFSDKTQIVFITQI
jgi:hypothetical protein